MCGSRAGFWTICGVAASRGAVLVLLLVVAAVFVESVNFVL